MTIGEKITHLRNAAGISQEALADKLSVSRQSVSKWEMDQAQPQIDKILQLCELFNISSDELLYDKITINRSKDSAPKKNKYFGTDGFRGEANLNLTSMQAYKVGRFWVGIVLRLFRDAQLQVTAPELLSVKIHAVQVICLNIQLLQV